MQTDEIKVVAMDLDGTLTQHKSPLEAPVRAALDRLRARYRLVVVGAGSCRRIFEQLGRYSLDILGNYGMQEAGVEVGRLTVLRDDVLPCDHASVERRVSALRRRMGCLAFAGESVEFHASGMVTFPLLGTRAQAADKLAFDPRREKRRRWLDAVREAFAEYTVFIGGTSSFDIVPRPYDKRWALARYLKAHGLTEENAVYAGDDYGPGGNDEQLYRSNIPFISVDSYRDFPAKTAFLLK